MKKKIKILSQKILPWLLLILCVLLVVIWLLILRINPGNEGLTVNDVINLSFFIAFSYISIKSSLRIQRISNLSNDFRMAYEQLHSRLSINNQGNDLTTDATNDYFKDSRALELYQMYNQEYSRLESCMPNGCKCNIEDYFNEPNFADYLETDWLNQIPGTLTGLGMLGTFFGLAMGLANFNFSFSVDSSESVNSLMSCIQLAFVTSISGLILSLVFNKIYRYFLKKMSENINLFIDEHHLLHTDSDHDGLNLLIENQNEQTGAIRTLANSISETVSLTLSNQMKHMEDTYLQACSLLEESQIKGMEILVDKFTEKLLGTLQDGINKLVVAIDQTCAFQKESTEKIKENIKSIISLSDNTTEIHRLSVETVEKLKDYTDHLDSNTNKLTEQVQANTASVIQAAANYEELVTLAGEFKNITLDLGEYAESMKNYNDDTAVNFEKMVAAFGDISSSFTQQQQLLNNIGENMKSSVVNAITSVIDASKQQVLSIEDSTEVQKNEIIKFSSTAINSINTAIEGYKDTMARVSDNLETQSNDVKNECHNTITQVEDVLKNYSENLQTASATMLGQIQNMDTTINHFPVVLGDFKDSVDKSAELMSTQIQSMNATANQFPVDLDRFKSSMDKNVELMSTHVHSIDTVANQIPSVVTNFNSSVEKVTDSLSQILEKNTEQASRTDTLMKMLLEKAAENKSNEEEQ